MKLIYFTKLLVKFPYLHEHKHSSVIVLLPGEDLFSGGLGVRNTKEGCGGGEWLSTDALDWKSRAPGGGAQTGGNNGYSLIIGPGQHYKCEPELRLERMLCE